MRFSAIENELKQIDKFKERQKVELQALIQHNLDKFVRNKENEERVKNLFQKRLSVDKVLFNRTNTSKY